MLGLGVLVFVRVWVYVELQNPQPIRVYLCQNLPLKSVSLKIIKITSPSVHLERRLYLNKVKENHIMYSIFHINLFSFIHEILLILGSNHRNYTQM